MSFMASYKHLEKLCGDVMGNQRRLSAYIEEMESKYLGPRYVAGWDADLRKLKHYRWVRNQIVHDPDCYEEDLCDPEDADWLEDFYNRIMDQTDPLALYRKATQPKQTPVPRRSVPQVPTASVCNGYVQPRAPQAAPKPQSGRRPAGCALFLLAAFGILVMLAF